jgi:hypothetical protein
LKTKLSDPTVIQDSNDALSTTLKVEDLRYELFNPVLIFKQQGVDDELKVLQRDDLTAFLQRIEKEKLQSHPLCWKCRRLLGNLFEIRQVPSE